MHKLYKLNYLGEVHRDREKTQPFAIKLLAIQCSILYWITINQSWLRALNYFTENDIFYYI